MTDRGYAILFVTPFDADTRAVDLATKRHGFGHVALWGGDADGPRPIVLDSSVGAGVGYRPLADMTRGAPYYTMRLEPHLGRYVFGRALHCLGAPYDLGGLFRARARDDAFTCSGLVCCALPPQLQEQMRPRGRPVSPNDLARGFGVPQWSPSP